MGAGVKTAKISSRGQIPLPRDVRKAPGTGYVSEIGLVDILSTNSR
jgi:hypothetical protein